jgi:hypothetical protein
MSTRHEIDGATPGRTVYDAAEVYDLKDFPWYKRKYYWIEEMLVAMR